MIVRKALAVLQCVGGQWAQDAGGRRRRVYYTFIAGPPKFPSTSPPVVLTRHSSPPSSVRWGPRTLSLFISADLTSVCTMPGDFSMCLCLSPPPPLQLCRPSTETLRPCLAPFPRPPDPRKKGVVFADALGLALTTVRHFSRSFFDEDPLVLALASLRVVRPFSTSSYTLEFLPPTHDYTGFQSKLNKQQVCLEQCAVQGATVAGTIKVRNLGYEKRVTLRVSYDNWQSHYDLLCSYLRDPYGGRETDMFSFRLPLAPGTQRAEFCICFWCQGKEYWDNNEGENYAVHKETQHGRYNLQSVYW